MISLPQKIESNIRDHDLLTRGQRVLVSVSGGVDSMVLVSILNTLTPGFGWSLSVAHLNHQLRGASSNADERLVIRTAKALKIPCVVDRANVRAAAKSKGVSLEMAGRKLRHEFLARVASERGIRTIALAHNLDDQIELFFLRLLRGSGSHALAGMKWSNPSPSNSQLTLVRPLLNCPKQVLREYAAQQRVHFREDASNASLDILRNRVRHELLPLLRVRYQAGLDKSIVKTMDILSEDALFVTQMADAWLQRHGIMNKQPGAARFGLAEFDSVRFEGLPVALQRCCVQRQLLILEIGPEFDLIEQLRQYPGKSIEVSVAGNPTRKSTEPDTVRSTLMLERKGGRILCQNKPVEVGFDTGWTDLELRLDGGHQWRGVRVAWRLEDLRGSKLPVKKSRSEVFDAEKVGDRVRLRHWRPGDRFQPIGMRKAVKLQDLFVNQKVPRPLRRKLLVAETSGGEVFWVEGLRVSERFKLTKQSIRRLHWRWQRL